MTEPFYFVEPGSGRKKLIGERTLPNQAEKIFSDSPSVGLVIGTYGAAPYIAVQLAVRKRLYPDIPVLVHDDASPETESIARICAEHPGVEFETNSSRLDHLMGDLSSVVAGLQWARDRGLELVAKMSRRFVPLTAWAPGLIELAKESQYATFSHVVHPHPLPLRSECFAMYVPYWSDEDTLGSMTKTMLTDLNCTSIEMSLYMSALAIHSRRCETARNWDRKLPASVARMPFAYWDFLKPSRQERTLNYLWHEFAEPAEYASVAAQLGLNYPADAFAGYSSPQGR